MVYLLAVTRHVTIIVILKWDHNLSLHIKSNIMIHHQYTTICAWVFLWDVKGTKELYVMEYSICEGLKWHTRSQMEVASKALVQCKR